MRKKSGSIIIRRLLYYIQSALKNNHLRILIVTSLYLLSLVFSFSNIMMILLTVVYTYAVWRISGNFLLAVFLGFLSSLPFENGKSFSLLLVPKNQIHLQIQNDVISYFTIRVSDIFLLVMVYFSITRRMSAVIGNTEKLIHFLLFAFITTIYLASIFSNYPEVSLLLFTQILKMIVIFYVPFYLIKQKHLQCIYQVIISQTIFEGSWGVLQYFFQRKLGSFIESVSSGNIYGKIAWEQKDLLRVSGTFIDPDLLSTFLLIQLAVLFTALFHDKIKDEWLKKSAWIAIVCGTTGLFLTGNRFIYILYAILISVSINPKHIWAIFKMSKHYPNIYILLSPVVLILPYLYVRLQGLFTLFSEHGSGTFRIQMILSSLILGFEDIFGVGIGMSPVYLAKYLLQNNPIYGADFPHNLVMQIFAESGIIGTIFFIAVMYLLFRKHINRLSTPASKPFYVGAIFFFLSALFYPLLFDGIEVISFAFLYIGIARSMDAL